MGLRDFLTGAQQFQQGGQEFSDTASKIRQQAAQQDLANKRADLYNQIRSGTPDQQSQAAANLSYLESQAGIKDPYAPEIGKMVFPDKSTKSAYSIDAVKQLMPDATPEEQYKFANQSREAQDAILKQRQAATHEAGVQSRFEKSQGTTVSGQENKQETKAFDVLNKTKDAFREKDYGLKEIRQALDRNTAIADNLVFNYVARQIGGEKGPLNEGDIQRAQGIIGFQGKAEEAKAFFTGKNYEKLSPDQKSELRGIVENNAKNFAEKKAVALAQDLNDLYSSQSKLRDADGNPVGILKSTLNELKKDKIPVTFDPQTKSFVVDKSTTEHTGGTQNLIKSASAIKDPAVKQKWITWLNANPNLSQDQIDHIAPQIKAAGGM